MKIWFQKHTVEGRLPLLDTWYREHLDAITGPDTTIHIGTLPADTYGEHTPFDYVGYGATALMFNGYFARTAVEAERAGFDAWVIAAGQDPGLREARALTSIPVRGYGETAFFMAAMANTRFSILGFMPDLQEPIRENVTRYGLDRLLTSYEMVDDGWRAVYDALDGDFDLFVKAYGDAAQRAAEKGAQLIVPGEGIPAEILWHLDIHTMHGLPVVDPAGLLVKLAELDVELTRHGILRRTTAGYWFRRPEPSVTEHLESVFWNSTLGKV